MSRSGYSDECDGWALICWRGAVERAILGKRGQKLLRDLRAALDAMPVKRLIVGALEQDGEVCALGAVGVARGLNMTTLNPVDDETIALAFDIAPALAKEIAFVNDDDFAYSTYGEETPEQRWRRVRKWVDRQIPKEEARDGS